MISFKNRVYPNLLAKLRNNNRYFTKTRNKPNSVKIEGDKVLVMSEKSKPEYIEIPYELFQQTWELLQDKGEVTQYELSKTHNVKRSAFMFIAFELLDEVEYVPEHNSLRVVREH